MHSLENILGLINYYHRHLENFLHSLEPLHGLLWNKVKWTWTKTENNAFENARELWSSANMLVHWYINKSSVLACNASPYWLWFVMFWAMGQKGLVHLWALTNPGRNYSQIDKEGVSDIFGAKKFDQCVFGNHSKLSLVINSNLIIGEVVNYVQIFHVCMGKYSWYFFSTL